MKNLFVYAVCSVVVVLMACNGSKPAEEGVKTTTAGESTALPPAEFADPKYSEMVKSGLASLSAGDVAAWLSSFSDNAVYAWGYGDSLVGKPAISEYWTKRRAEVLDSLTFANPIFLPVKINTPQSVEAPGVWVLAWYETTAKYKPSGKKMTQWIHTDNHFNADGKIDRVIQYVDRVAINNAMAK